MTLRVVVNADDLGLHVAVRRAVEQLAERGRLTSASVLANGPDLLEAAKTRGVSLGAHLNVLRGRPLSPPYEIPSLVREDGFFLGNYRQLYLRYVRGSLDLAEVELEWARQVELLLGLGVALSHADGEKHTHAWPGLFGVAVRVAARFGIPFVRLPRERWAPAAGLAGQARVAALRWWLRDANRVLDQAQGVHALDEVWGIAHQGDELTAARFDSAFQDASAVTDGVITPRTVEIVCHPGEERAGDGDLASEFGTMRVRALWRPECRNLKDPAWTERIAARGWQVVSFADLARERDSAPRLRASPT